MHELAPKRLLSSVSKKLHRLIPKASHTLLKKSFDTNILIVNGSTLTQKNVFRLKDYFNSLSNKH
jgi:hypothetical protein